MKKVIQSLMALFIALSSSFIVYKVNPIIAEAKICPPGQYSPYNENTNSFDKCKKTATEKDNTKMGNINKANGYFRALAMTIAGVSLGVAVLMIVYSGFLYTVSEGDAEKIKKAKFHLIAAGTGVVISSLSFVIYGIMEAVIK